MTKKLLHAFTIKYDFLCREIRTSVIVINVYDRSKYAEYSAIWDTGATVTAITDRIAKDLDCKPTSVTKITNVGNEPVKAQVYDLSLMLPNNVLVDNIEVISTPKIGGEDNVVLIGMDIISQGDFAITNYGNKTVATFSHPPHRNKLDFVERANQVNKRKKR